MKKNILSLIVFLSLILIVNNVFAADGDLIVNGNLGVGTTTLSSKLSVAGTIESTSGGIKFPDGSTQITASKVVQVVNYQRSDRLTSSSTIPTDDTIPQITEGTQILTVSITPKSATNKLLIDVNANVEDYAGGNYVMALFQDSTANALAASRFSVAGGYTIVIPSTLKYYMAAGTTSSTTFTVRVGGSGSPWYLNGNTSGRLYGGVYYSSITITEIAP